MKKQIIASGLLVLVGGTSSAQSNVTLYAIVVVVLRAGNATTSIVNPPSV